MKTLLLTILTLMFAQNAFAKGGVKSPQEMALRNSAAGFAHESLEHATRILNATTPDAIHQVIGASIQLISATDSVVSIQLSDGTLASYNCLMVQDFSKGGTVVKNEARCTPVL